jgi:TrmH family RNA methyltransferase
MLRREITSLQHPIVKHLVKLRESRKHREQSGSVLISGVKLVSELSCLFPLKTLLIAANSPPLQTITAGHVFVVSHSILKKITGLQEPEPLAAEIALPQPSSLHNKKTLLILDGIADPGNVGTLFRTALAFNWEGVFLTPHTVDPFNEKAIRAAKGATFKIPYREGSYEELEKLLQENQMSLLIADVTGEHVYPNNLKNWEFGKEAPQNFYSEQATLAKRQGASENEDSEVKPTQPKTNFSSCLGKSDVSLSKPYALVLGNESHGVNPILKARGRQVTIPLNPKVESLNVAAAGAILMYMFRNPHD